MAGSFSRKARVLVTLALAVVACVVIAAALWWHSEAYVPPPLAFDGPSDGLQQTVLVPTLDTPMPDGKNVIWCASFQLAWNEFRDDVIGEPVQIKGAQEIADRLNASTITGTVLEPADYYAKAGFIEDDIVEAIERDMAARFPDVPKPDIPVSDITVAVAYAYLQADAEFKYAFDDYDRQWLFGDVPVRAFGVFGRKRGRVPNALRAQVQVLYCSTGSEDSASSEDEFIIDPCRHTMPYQIILARVARQATLAETLARVNDAIARMDVAPDGGELVEGSTLLVPSIRWRLEHRFREIEGTDKPLLNRGHEGNWLGVALQRIDFDLLRTGARLRSEAVVLEEKRAESRRRFVFDRPFLIIMRTRGTTEPFFVMWVDNAELLCTP
jgi:hypothetical protein